MKKTLCGFAVLLSLLLAVSCAVPKAQATNETQSGLSDLNKPTAMLDLVILLDDSGSMYRNHQSNDVDAYRFDAAAIMLNMCESTGTRASVLTFGNQVSSVGMDTLREIDLTGQVRGALTDRLQTMARNALGEDGDKSTNLGNAIAKAVSVLDQGAADRNGRQPVILLLADGNDDGEADVLTEAKEACIQKGYKIYSVLLGDDFTGGSTTLKDLAKDTHGRYFALVDATDLPMMFSQVFADQTGAEQTSTQKTPELVEGTTNTWQVTINVPNHSVRECNVMIPTAELSDIKLFRPDGQEADIENDDKLFQFTVGATAKREEISQPRFEQYKILNPSVEGTELGKWHLQFKARIPQMQIKYLSRWCLTISCRFKTM